MRTTLLALLSRLTRATTFPDPICEIGSLRVPGQEHLPFVGDFFPGQRFLGCDLRPGVGVDVLQDAHCLGLADESLGTVLMLDVIEHVREPWRALAEVRRCLRPGGLLLVTSVWYFPIHAYPDDYWRFTASAFSTLLGGGFEPISIGMCGMPRLPHTVYALASRGPIDPGTEQALQSVVSDWRKHGASSWKELVMAVTPPALLTPAYSWFLRAMRLLPSRKRALERTRRQPPVVAGG